ncbi:hypothetical protein Hanom_Chr07g00660731 [Helianthus anomalus]
MLPLISDATPFINRFEGIPNKLGEATVEKEMTDAIRNHIAEHTSENSGSLPIIDDILGLKFSFEGNPKDGIFWLNKTRFIQGTSVPTSWIVFHTSLTLKSTSSPLQFFQKTLLSVGLFDIPQEVLHNIGNLLSQSDGHNQIPFK